MANNDITSKFSKTDSEHIGSAIESVVAQKIMQRRRHERRWYDNMFFDDGYHFRVVSRKTGQVIDHLDKNTGYVERAIPRASRQIRGVANLIYAAEPYPVVYPKRITEADYQPATQDPKTGQMIPDPQFEAAMKQSQTDARKKGVWLIYRMGRRAGIRD